MKTLNGSELAGFIKERQARAVRGLRQAGHIFPKLAIIQTVDIPVIDTYVRLKKAYGADILIDVEAYKLPQHQALKKINELNDNTSVHGIIVQLPLDDPAETDEIVNAVSPHKDVDGLGKNPDFDPATPMAINWLLAGYNVELTGKKIAIVGAGRLVGAPLARMWRASNLDIELIDAETLDAHQKILVSDIVVTATGSPNAVRSDDLKVGAVVVDAGTASESGKIVGDLSADVRERTDLIITPEKGGVGPLTICALFENVIRAARQSGSPEA